MRFDPKFILAISHLAGAHATLHMMILCEGPNAYQLYSENIDTVRTTLDISCEHLEVYNPTKFPTTEADWRNAKKTLEIDDVQRRKSTRQQLKDRYGLDAAELYDYSLLVSDYLWLITMGYGDKIPHMLLDDIRKQSMIYGIDEKLVERFIDKPTPGLSEEMLLPIINHFNYVTWFVSYSHDDLEFVDKLVDFIETDRVRVWRDVKRMAAGDVIKSSILEGIQRCDIFSVVLSANSIQSEWVKWECKTAVARQEDRGKPKIVPIVIDNVRIPTFLTNYLVADFNISFEDGLNGIIEAIKAMTGLTT